MNSLEGILSDRYFYLVRGGLLLLLLCVGLASCDPGSVQPLVEDSPGETPDGSTLGYAPMPTGTSLPSPGDVPLRNGTVQAYEKANNSPEAAPANSESSGTDTSSIESPYGCYLASRPYTDAVQFRSVYLYFPEAMVEAAGEETARVLLSLQAASVSDSASVAGTDLAVAFEQRRETGVRYANCVIPAASGAESLVNEQLIRAGEESATADAVQAAEANSEVHRKYQVCFVQEVTYCASIGNTCSDWETDYYVTCSGAGPSAGGGDDGGYPEGGDGTSGGGDGPRNDEDCSNRSQPGSSLGGAGESKADPKRIQTPPPGPGSSCPPVEPDPVNPDKLCSRDPLKKMEIRPTCNGVDGGRFGWTREDENGNEVFHGGLDLLADKGTDLHAMEGGEVVRVNNIDDFGNFVVVQSNKNGERFFLYAHLSSVTVGDDQVVSEGEKIGETGKSGNAEEAACNPEHLHLEVRKGKDTEFGWVKGNGAEAVNPEPYVGTEFNDNGAPVSDEC